MKVKYYRTQIGSKIPPTELGHLILRKRRFNKEGSEIRKEFNYCPENRFEKINYRINDLFSLQKEADRDGEPNYSKVYFVNLTWFQILQLKWMFGQHLFQHQRFWMRLVNITVAGLAVLMGWLNLQQSNRLKKMEQRLETKEQFIQSKEKEIFKLNSLIKALELKNDIDTIKTDTDKFNTPLTTPSGK